MVKTDSETQACGEFLLDLLTKALVFGYFKVFP